MVFNPLGPQSPEPLGRILTQALDHHNQIPPLHGVCPLLGIILGQTEPATLQSLDIYHHTAVLGMDKLHELAAVADEDEDIVVPHLRTEFILYDANKGIDALAQPLRVTLDGRHTKMEILYRNRMLPPDRASM